MRISGIARLPISSSEAYHIILEEEEGGRKLPIVIDPLQAQSIARALQDVPMPRPLTHDLMVEILRWAGVDLVEVYIHTLRDGVYYADMVCVRDGEEHVFDARPSDALALAVRWGVPIYVKEEVLKEASLSPEDIESFLRQLETLGRQAMGEEAEEEARGEDDDVKRIETMGEGELETYFSPDRLKNYSTDQIKRLLHHAIRKEYYLLAALFQDELNRREGGSQEN